MGNALRACAFPVLSFAIGIGYLWLEHQPFPIPSAYFQVPIVGSMLFWLAFEVTFSPALALLVFFGYVHSKPREIWFYAFLMWLPKLSRVVPALQYDLARNALFIPAAAVDIFILVLAAVTLLVPYFGLILRRYEKPATTPSLPL